MHKQRGGCKTERERNEICNRLANLEEDGSQQRTDLVNTRLLIEGTREALANHREAQRQALEAVQQRIDAAMVSVGRLADVVREHARNHRGGRRRRTRRRRKSRRKGRRRRRKTHRN